ncbi:phosphatase PAP2 family protein [Rhizobium sp. XQZ8]|uniref:phosphatase PAP2 family protein n=1 Tax=Rhizobium populisoli TaxID=2859785 RepID=UPI001CA5C55A|nr:phosphatase PAP2 family protein [Rhizobium populisoli]MBW6420531.1 phosphatase PAP2 family protein [Rhizobium populisoli]
MPALADTISRWRNTVKRYFAKPMGWFVVLMAVWWVLLAAFYLIPELDLSVARAFFVQAACGQSIETGKICGGFPYGSEAIYVAIRRILFYMPSVVAIYILYRLIANLQHSGSGYSRRKTRDYSIALVSFIVGPYVLVNLILKQVSNRPRPYETDLFAGKYPFMPAGDFNGACNGNCSFISGEAAAAGWLACLIVLMPKPLRPILGPPLIAISIVSPALRTSFGGHYLSDVTLGFLSSMVVYAGVAACFEMSQRAGNRNSPTNL